MGVHTNGVFNRVNAVFLFLLYDREGMVQVRFWHDDFYLTVFKNSSKMKTKDVNFAHIYLRFPIEIGNLLCSITINK